MFTNQKKKATTAETTKMVITNVWDCIEKMKKIDQQTFTQMLDLPDNDDSDTGNMFVSKNSTTITLPAKKRPKRSN